MSTSELQSEHPAPSEKKLAPKILRFRKSERHLHWALAIPFLGCFFSAMILVLLYNPDPIRPYRALFSWMHRISGLFFLFLPPLVCLKNGRDFRLLCYNVKQAWIWTAEDVKWLLLMGLAALSSKIRLPEQGKFNAAEKLNFMNLMATYPLYILTGTMVWVTDNAFAAWLIHCCMAVMATPLLGGHIFMATINPASRLGLSGMVSGFVDRHWARLHYTKWYREHFEKPHALQASGPEPAGGGELEVASERGDINALGYSMPGKLIKP